MPLQATIYAAIRTVLSGVQDFGTPYWDRPKALDIELVNGTGSGQADRTFSDQRTVAASSNDDLDLSGTLLDPIGGSAVFVKIKAIVIRAAAANTTNLTIGNGANPFVGPFGAGTHTMQLQPGGAIVLVAPNTGWNVVAATGDILRIANGAGASATYDIDIIGTSA